MSNAQYMYRYTDTLCANFWNTPYHRAKMMQLRASKFVSLIRRDQTINADGRPTLTESICCKTQIFFHTQFSHHNCYTSRYQFWYADHIGPADDFRSQGVRSHYPNFCMTWSCKCKDNPSGLTMIVRGCPAFRSLLL